MLSYVCMCYFSHSSIDLASPRVWCGTDRKLQFLDFSRDRLHTPHTGSTVAQIRFFLMSAAANASNEVIDAAWVNQLFPKATATVQKTIYDALQAEMILDTVGLSVAVKSRGWDGFKLPLVVKGVLENLVPAAQSIEERFVTHLEEESTKAAEPWRRLNQSAIREIKRLGDSIPKELKEEITTQLKVGALDEFEVLYVLCARILASDDDKKFYDGLFVRYTTYETRVVAHNWYVANSIGASFLDQHGAKITSLQFPLLPQHVVPEFAFYNAQLLNMCGPVSGAGPATAERPSFLSKKAKHASAAGVSGGGTLPVLADVNGNPVIDVGEIELAWRDMKTKIAQQQREIKDIRKKLQDQRNTNNSGTQHGSQHGSQHGAQHGGNAAPTYPRARGGFRGGGGGRGSGRGITGSGPAQDENQAQAQSQGPPPNLPAPPQPGMVWDPIVGWRF